jgi:hypothetical protein
MSPGGAAPGGAAPVGAAPVGAPDVPPVGAPEVPLVDPPMLGHFLVVDEPAAGAVAELDPPEAEVPALVVVVEDGVVAAPELRDPIPSPSPSDPAPTPMATIAFLKGDFTFLPPVCGPDWACTEHPHLPRGPFLHGAHLVATWTAPDDHCR